MLYALNEFGYYVSTPWRLAARAAREFWASPLNPAADTDFGRKAHAAADLFANVTRRYGKPDWNIDAATTKGRRVRVTPTIVWSSPWVDLVHFARGETDFAQETDLAEETDFAKETDFTRATPRAPDPKVLIVAPLSGHYATLLRGTVEAFLPDHEVFVTDWVNARQVPLSAGRFDFHDYIDLVRQMLTVLGGRAHVVAVCQPGPPVLAAAALMAEDGDPARPASMTFMGSPIDARLAPTAPNLLAEQRPFAWFASTMIHTVPPPYPGAMRRVYPGFVQLYSFMSMNAERHQDAHRAYFDDLVKGDGDQAAKHLEFYDEYLSVLDLTEEFYLQTIDIVFQRHLLPRGLLEHRGRTVKPAAIADIALMTVEGELDDISGVGQTQAAHALCRGCPRPAASFMCSPGWDTTASSTAAAFGRRSIRACGRSSPGTRRPSPGARRSRDLPPVGDSPAARFAAPVLNHRSQPVLFWEWRHDPADQDHASDPRRPRRGRFGQRRPRAMRRPRLRRSLDLRDAGLSVRTRAGAGLCPAAYAPAAYAPPAYPAAGPQAPAYVDQAYPGQAYQPQAYAGYQAQPYPAQPYPVQAAGYAPAPCGTCGQPQVVYQPPVYAPPIYQQQPAAYPSPCCAPAVIPAVQETSVSGEFNGGVGVTDVGGGGGGGGTGNFQVTGFGDISGFHGQMASVAANASANASNNSSVNVNVNNTAYANATSSSTSNSNSSSNGGGGKGGHGWGGSGGHGWGKPQGWGGSQGGGQDCGCNTGKTGSGWTGGAGSGWMGGGHGGSMGGSSWGGSNGGGGHGGWMGGGVGGGGGWGGHKSGGMSHGGGHH